MTPPRKHPFDFCGTLYDIASSEMRRPLSSHHRIARALRDPETRQIEIYDPLDAREARNLRIALRDRLNRIVCTEPVTGHPWYVEYIKLDDNTQYVWS